NIPANTITVIPKGAFEVIDGAYEFVIPEGVTEIGDEAFRESGYLAYIEIPSTVTKIGDRAFYDMDDLHKLTIPSTVTQLGEEIVTVFDESDPDKVTLYVDEGSKALEYAKDNNVPYEINKQ
ncbi:MAG: leucine-rich repeat domain-containing protein, partial [Acutalibacteraceae bacterium]